MIAPIDLNGYWTANEVLFSQGQFGVLNELEPLIAEFRMAKAYWVATYRSVRDPNALATYAKLSGPAITAGGDRILVPGLPAVTYEAGSPKRTAVIEFENVEHVQRVHDSPAYQEALALLGDRAERDICIVEGMRREAATLSGLCHRALSR